MRAPTAISDPECQGLPKPSFQSGAALAGGLAVYGSPSDGVRDIPDVAMFAANGVWGHFETVCWSDPTQTSGGAASCSGPAQHLVRISVELPSLLPPWRPSSL